MRHLFGLKSFQHHVCIFKYTDVSMAALLDAAAPIRIFVPGAELLVAGNPPSPLPRKVSHYV